MEREETIRIALLSFTKILMKVVLSVMLLWWGQSGIVQAKSIKIGCTIPLTYSWGVEVKQALELCVDILNKEGGLEVGAERFDIDIVIYDDKYNPAVAESAVQRLIHNDRVKAVVGTCGSGPAVASLPVVQAAGIPFFTSAFSDKLLDPKLRYVYATTTARSVDFCYPLI